MSQNFVAWDKLIDTKSQGKLFVLIPFFLMNINLIKLSSPDFQRKSFDLANAWIPYLSHINPEIKILVCNCCTDNDGKIKS